MQSDEIIWSVINHQYVTTLPRLLTSVLTTCRRLQVLLLQSQVGTLNQLGVQ